MRHLTLTGRKIMEGACTSTALVSHAPISFLGGVNPTDGKVTLKNKDIPGQCVKDKILVFPEHVGSTVGSYVLYSLSKRGLAPAAIIVQEADAVIAVGAVIANIPMIDRVDISQIKTGDTVQVDGEKGTATILKRAKS